MISPGEVHDLFQFLQSRTHELNKRSQSLQGNTYKGSAEGLEEGDETATTRPLTQQEVNQIRANMANLCQQMIDKLTVVKADA